MATSRFSKFEVQSDKKTKNSALERFFSIFYRFEPRILKKRTTISRVASSRDAAIAIFSSWEGPGIAQNLKFQIFFKYKLNRRNFNVFLLRTIKIVSISATCSKFDQEYDRFHQVTSKFDIIFIKFSIFLQRQKERERKTEENEEDVPDVVLQDSFRMKWRLDQPNTKSRCWVKTCQKTCFATNFVEKSV